MEFENGFDEWFRALGLLHLHAVREARDRLVLVGDWNEDLHPRRPAGGRDGQGGQFAPRDVEPPAPSRPLASPGLPAGGERVADVVPICTKGSHSTTVVDGITHYWAEYNCLDGRTLERYSIGKRLDGFIPQP